jgi:hypothetical protein
VRPTIPLLAGAVLALIVLWIPLSPIVAPKPTRLWRGYQTLFVRCGGSAEARLPAALGRLGPGVISEYTSTVDFYDFSSSVRFPYGDLARRLDRFDPRRDPYLDAIGGYFTVTSGVAEFHVLYIPARSTGFALFHKLSRLLGPCGGGTWRLVDFDPLEKSISMIAPVALAMLFPLGAARRREGSLAIAAAGAILWLPCVLTCGPSALALCLLLLFFWLQLLRARLASPMGQLKILRKSRTPFFLYVSVAAVSIVVFFLMNGRLVSMLAQPLAPFVCSLLLVLLVPFFTAATDGWRRARIFAAVPLFRNSMDASPGRQRTLSVALFAIAFAVLVPLLHGGAFPSPIPVAGARNFSWDAIARLRQASHAHQLPDFSDFLSHEAYQQTLGFGRKWKEPMRDERVYRHEYLVNPGSGVVRARLRTVKVFDSTWLASVKANATPASLEALLVSQGRAVAAAVRGPARMLAGELPFTALVFCALLALLGRDLRVGLLIRGNLWRLNGEARRDQIP